MEIRTGKPNIEHRTQSFKMRPEQQEAVERTAQYFTNIKQDEAYRNKEPHFLWNAKMRFGKTFTAYQLAKKMGWKKILILTFKPAVHNAWQEDLENHIDFEGWQFVSNNENTLSYVNTDGTTINFRIGDDVRVAEDGEYVFYRLYDLAGGKASWQESGSGTALPGNVYLTGANYYNESVRTIKQGYLSNE